MVLYRFLFACVGMLPVIVTHRVRLTAGETRTLLLAAFFGIPIQFMLQFHGLVLTTVSHAALMVGAMPVLLAAAAALFAGSGWTGLAGWRCAVPLAARRWWCWAAAARPPGAKRLRWRATCW